MMPMKMVVKCGSQTNMESTMKTIETQIGQLALVMKESSSRSFPSDIEKNPKEFKAITLRSGKVLENLTRVDEEKEEAKMKKLKWKIIRRRG